MTNRKFTKLDNRFIKDSEFVLDSQELTILTLISMHESINKQYIFTIGSILNLLNVTNNNNKKQQQIKDLLKKLVKDEYIQIYNTTVSEDKYLIKDIDKVDKNSLLFASTMEEAANFTKLYDEEVLKILEYSKNNRIDLYSLMNLYIYIISCINCNKEDEDYNFCYISNVTIVDKLGISENSIIKYINILQELNIIRCDYAGYKETAKGQIKNDVTHYCRFEHEEMLINRLEKIRKEKGFIKVNPRSKDKSNLKRSLKQQMNNLNKKKEDKTITEVEKISYELIKEEYEILCRSKG